MSKETANDKTKPEEEPTTPSATDSSTSVTQIEEEINNIWQQYQGLNLLSLPIPEQSSTFSAEIFSTQNSFCAFDPATTTKVPEERSEASCDPHEDYDSDYWQQDSTVSMQSGSRYAMSSNADLYDHAREDLHSSGRYLRCAPSTESLLALLEAKRFRTPRECMQNVPGISPTSTKGEPFSSELPPLSESTSNATLVAETTESFSTDYPAWSEAGRIGLPSAPHIHGIFVQLKNVYGFQQDSMRNMYDHLMVMLDSRASRMSLNSALLTLHADYIGGPNANYRKWYFAAQLDLDDAVGSQHAATRVAEETCDELGDDSELIEELKDAEEGWRLMMERMPDSERVRQLALWLLIWAEASMIRFCPEALCYIFKLADDHWHARAKDVTAPEGEFLDSVIVPLYTFIRDQAYRQTPDGSYIKRERDHASIIGYDDVNQLFWYPEAIARLRLKDGNRLIDLPSSQRYQALPRVDWPKAFQKTFKEKRSWMHLAINFTRIWIIHIVPFWYYISANATSLYLSSDKAIASKELGVKLSVVALGGALATLLMTIGSFAEYLYVPMTWHGARLLTRRVLLLLIIFVFNAGPSVYCIYFDRTSQLSVAVGVLQLLISLCTSISFAIIPQAQLFVHHIQSDSRKTLANQTFTANFPHLKRMDRLLSIGLWFCVFSCKLIESYFFLALSFKDPLEIMSQMTIQNCEDSIIGSALCTHMPNITLGFMLLMELILFFLDTYLWYVIWNTIFSVARSFYLGISIWTPWRNIFSRLPKRIYAKVLAASEIDGRRKPKVLCSQIWNAIVVSMYREHLLSTDHVARLLFHQIPVTDDGKHILRSPTFFQTQEDAAFKTEYYPKQSEAERRMQFFAHSLTTPMPEPLPVPNMPTFTVMTPHFSEKIILSLREIIREEDNSTRITLLEYLKQLHAFEWDNFVKDTKVLADEKLLSDLLGEDGTQSETKSSSMSSVGTLPLNSQRSKVDDLPFYCVGFKSSAPENTLRTRIWASLRSQTLYRTITGFMNYQNAIKLLYRVENAHLLSTKMNVEQLEDELNQMSDRKFRFLLAMQRYKEMSKDDRENVDFILNAYPNLQIAYIEKETDLNQVDKEKGISTRYYSVLIDGYCPIQADGQRTPKYRVRLPGNPILGDGKSDNQNNALIFYRGEYLQLIDANQDNYLEECLKIRNVLGEFENLHGTDKSPYTADSESVAAPVAIVGAREYIFSENVGVLGDVAAGKEQTFGTLTQRINATIGGKLHYGHPDFLNAVFMTTRGGVSKAQKGLHLNEDIYAGMNAFERGGRIKHIEYYQCGKGRDLGFGSVLNFATKIGTGMGEQMLSREYYYLGTQLPLDRFLTFYYAHPGFHINNIFIMLSVHMFMLVLLFLGALGQPLTVCETDNDGIGNHPDGCYNLMAVLSWLKRVVISIFVIFFASFLPLFLQEFTERGFLRAITRFCKHILSFSPFFEIFATQTYAHSILSNLSFGGARYIATGRGFAISRLPFSTLYSRFADSSMYTGARSALILLFGSLVVWVPHLAYFWITTIALVLSPFLFNPHQFSLSNFLLDYRDFLRWLSRGNGKSHANSWIGYCRFIRMRTTGVKSKQLGNPSEISNPPKQPRAQFTVVFFSEIFMPFCIAVISMMAYLFTHSFDASHPEQPIRQPQGLIRIGIIAVGPIILNASVLIGLFVVSLLLGSPAAYCCRVKFGATIASVAHGWAVVNFFAFVELLYYLENWHFSSVILGMIAVDAVQKLIFKVITVCFLTRELQQDQSNLSWWTGRWYGRGLGKYAFSQPLREFVCKVVEMSLFTTDCILGHVIFFALFPLCLIPGIDKWHSLILFWLRPSQQIRPPIFSASQRKRRRRICIIYGCLLTCLMLIFVALFAVPAILGPTMPF